MRRGPRDVTRKERRRNRSGGLETYHSAARLIPALQRYPRPAQYAHPREPAQKALAYDHRMKLLDLAALGMDCLAAVAAAFYTSAKLVDQIQKTDGEKPAIRSGTTVGLEAWSPTSEKLLVTWGSRFKDPYVDMVEGWGEWIWDRLAFLGWAKIPLFIPAVLALFILIVPWVLLRLPFLIVSFLLDRDNDFRLRIIVLSFALGLCLQAAGALVG
jgi:hypothetical protein